MSGTEPVIKHDLGLVPVTLAFLAVLGMIALISLKFFPLTDILRGLLLVMASSVLSASITWYAVSRANVGRNNELSALLVSYGNAARAARDAGPKYRDFKSEAVRKHVDEIRYLLVRQDEHYVQRAREEYREAIEKFLLVIEDIKESKRNQQRSPLEAWSVAKGKFLSLCLTQAGIRPEDHNFPLFDEVAIYTNEPSTMRRLW